MNDDMGRRVDELRRQAETLKANQRSRARKVRTEKTGARNVPDFEAWEPFEGVEDTIEDLENAMHQISEMTEDRIAQHPIASVAAAFAIGVLVGRLTKSQE